MGKFSSIRNCILGVTVAMLILVQSVFAGGLPMPDATQEVSTSTHNTEVKQEMAAKASYVVVDTRVTLATFLYFWLARVFTIDVPLIAYYNCEAFFINPHSFNIYYTCLSALAP